MEQKIVRDVETDDAPKATALLSQGKIVPAGSDIFYSSGVIGMDPKTMQVVSEDVIEQAEQVMKSIGALLKAANTTYDNVIKATDMENFAVVNEVYIKYFDGDSKPARTCVAVRTLPKNVKVEIEFIAFVPKQQKL